MTDTLTAFVLVLEAAADRLRLLTVRREARVQGALAALACEANGRAYQRLADGTAWLPLLLGGLRDDADRLAAVDAATSPTTVAHRIQSVQDDLAAIARVVTTHPDWYARTLALNWELRDKRAWDERLSDYGRDQQDEGAAWDADLRDAQTDRLVDAQVFASAPTIPSASIGQCALCRCPVYDERHRVRVAGDNPAFLFCSHECADEALNGPGSDPRHEPDASESAALPEARNPFAPDFDQAPF